MLRPGIALHVVLVVEHKVDTRVPSMAALSVRGICKAPAAFNGAQWLEEANTELDWALICAFSRKSMPLGISTKVYHQRGQMHLVSRNCQIHMQCRASVASFKARTSSRCHRTEDAHHDLRGLVEASFVISEVDDHAGSARGEGGQFGGSNVLCALSLQESWVASVRELHRQSASRCTSPLLREEITFATTSLPRFLKSGDRDGWLVTATIIQN